MSNTTEPPIPPLSELNADLASPSETFVLSREILEMIVLRACNWQRLQDAQACEDAAAKQDSPEAEASLLTMAASLRTEAT